MLNEVFFQDARVPAGNLVGERDEGWQVAMSALNLERSGIESIGRARGLLEDMVAYAKETMRHGGPLFNLAGVRSRLAEMSVRIEACRLAAYRVAWLRDQGQSPVYESSMSKLLSSEMWQQFRRHGHPSAGPVRLPGTRFRTRASRWEGCRGVRERRLRDHIRGHI